LCAQGLYADYGADLQDWPTAMFGDVWMPPTNPFIPHDLQVLLDSRPDRAERVAIDKRLSVLGPRVSSFDYDVHQATLGMRGDISAGWSYDSYMQIGANDQTDRQARIPLISRIEELAFAQDGGVSICGGFDPFGVDSIPAECLAYISVDGMNRAGF